MTETERQSKLGGFPYEELSVKLSQIKQELEQIAEKLADDKIPNAKNKTQAQQQISVLPAIARFMLYSIISCLPKVLSQILTNPSIYYFPLLRVMEER